MAIVGVEWCDFIVWTTKDMSVETIAFDNTFWTTCVHQLQFIYQTYVLPEIIYPHTQKWCVAFTYQNRSRNPRTRIN